MDKKVERANIQVCKATLRRIKLQHQAEKMLEAKSPRLVTSFIAANMLEEELARMCFLYQRLEARYYAALRHRSPIPSRSNIASTASRQKAAKKIN